MMRIRLLSISIALLAFGLTACSAFGGDDDNSNNNAAVSGNSVEITWDKDPYAVVFRAEIKGGSNEDAFFRRNDIPTCTVYGGGQVVWTISNGSGVDVIFDQVDEGAIAAFIEYLAFQREVFNYEAGADLVLSDQPPVVEQLTLTVDGRTHVTDGFGDWPARYYETLVQDCIGIASQPQYYEPDGGWVSAQVAPQDASAPFNIWSVEATGIDLQDLSASNERVWVEGRIAKALWNWIRNSPPNLQFGQGATMYYIALEVPAVTRSAPPPPDN